MDSCWTLKGSLTLVRCSLKFLSRAEKTIHHDPRLRHKSPPSNNMSSPLHPLHKYLTGCVQFYIYIYILCQKVHGLKNITDWLARYQDQISAFEIDTDLDFRFLLVSKLYITWILMYNAKCKKVWLCITALSASQWVFPKVYF